jgi:NAD(P)-dependent dehydrogenase (short-subunit alcohol dehydrogenase family)
MEKTIFITGASSGLGKASAILFAQRGWDVIATMRNPKKESDFTPYPNIRVMQLDVTDPEQIIDVAAEVISNGVPDIVFNNAGYGLAGPLEGTTDAQITQQVSTNLLGVIRVTKAFIPSFRLRKSGIFISTTSIGGLVTFPFNSVYHATKWALEGWSESLAFELGQFGICVKTVSPGGIATDFASRSLVLANHPAYKEDLDKVMQVFADPARAANHSTAEQIAEVVYEAATDGENRLRYIAGADAKAIYEQRLVAGGEKFRNGIHDRFFGK